MPPVGQPAELHREDVDEHEPEPEARHRLAEHGGDRADVVEQPVAAHRRQDAERDRDRERQEQRGARQQQRGGQPLEHEAERVAPVAQRLAEVAADRARR